MHFQLSDVQNLAKILYKRNASSLSIHKPSTDFIEIQYKNIVQINRQFRFVGPLIYNEANFFIFIQMFCTLAAK